MSHNRFVCPKDYDFVDALGRIACLLAWLVPPGCTLPGMAVSSPAPAFQAL
jgi:hypothetical protein